MECSDAVRGWIAARDPRGNGLGLGAHPALLAIRDVLDLLYPLEKGGEGKFVQALREILIDDAWVTTFVDDVVTQLAQGLACDAPFPIIDDGVRRGIVVVDHPLTLISISVVSADALAAKKCEDAERSIVFPGNVSLIRFLRAGGAHLRFWDMVDGRCTPAPARILTTDGMILTIDGSRRAYTIDRARADIVMLHATIRPGQAAMVREFDAESLSTIGMSSNDEAASRAQMMLSLLRLERRSDAVPCFAGILDSPLHFLRWHAMREFLALDLGAALPHLRRLAASDPHEEVRAAALTTLAAVEARFPCFKRSDACRD